MVKNLFYMFKRVLFSIFGLAPNRALDLLIMLKTILSNINLCRPLTSFTKTKTAVPVADFNGSLIRKTLRRTSRRKLINMLAKVFRMADSNVSTTVVFNFVNTLVFGPGKWVV